MQNNLIFDIGCHKGEDSDFYLKKGFTIVAVEASPSLCAELRKRFANGIAEGRFILVENAIAEKEGEVEFFSNTDKSDWGTTKADWAQRNEHLGTKTTKTIVPAVTFASLVQRFGVPYYLKIDIEGSDLLCLKGLLSFKERPRYVSLESDKRSWFALRTEMNLLKKLGYTRFQIVDQGTVPQQVPPNPAKEGKYVDCQFELGASGLFGKELPGPWLTRQGAIAAYRPIFLRYFLSGDYGFLKKWRHLRRFAHYFRPSWYDTHAALEP